MKRIATPAAIATAMLAVAAWALDKSESANSLSKPGFVFIELVTGERLPDYIKYFERVAGFKLQRQQRGYASMLSERAELSLMDGRSLPEGHPNKLKPTDRRLGLGVEIVIIVADLDTAFARAAEFKEQGWHVSSGIARRPWGPRDFRILSPDGYYLRFSEPM